MAANYLVSAEQQKVAFGPSLYVTLNICMPWKPQHNEKYLTIIIILHAASRVIEFVIYNCIINSIEKEKIETLLTLSGLIDV